MASTLAIVVGFVLVAVVFAVVMDRRRREPPVRDAFPIPAQLDRADFDRPDAPWLVALFSSATCHACQDVRAKVEVLAGPDVAIEVCDYEDRRDLHDRYQIEGVPLIAIADGLGVVRRGFVGPVTATDLWAAVAAVRDPNSDAEPGLGALP